MDKINSVKTYELLINKKDIIVDLWEKEIKLNKIIKKSVLSDNDVKSFCTQILDVFMSMLSEDKVSLNAMDSNGIKGSLELYSRTTALKGMGPMEISMYIYSLKTIVFKVLQKDFSDDNASINSEIIRLSDVFDKMSLFTFNLYVKERENIILRQQQDMIELSTPVISVWDRILAVPLIGTLDSKRTQLIMEKLLEMIVETGSLVAIIDITGVPTVDTLVANHLLKTASAIKLLGAEIIITGISPAIAQTMVHLGVDLSGVMTKALMADGIKLAYDMMDYRVVKVKKS
ncbi:STAS domain-containing protein [Pseudobacteroides cellulosolvens]|uniref:Anti-sigma-factor antagonist for Sigma B n=1 Tax=Pseudobacteroides cellulosolvens ATCC 35603 = DSM 2933 TaxID=398512 RepID=A0A0L6JKA9_9FIRM|nr:STAS domain-containing protein [Pseudobacteroides cellulosolvens]KNY26296.1 anti-sigma-factor antagonist for Sigma B [Pseudobacteroides cellulosolvens ATCC 35603 = DSM 2933]